MKTITIASCDLRLDWQAMRRERVRLGLTQAQVAERLEVERSLVSYLERGVRQPSWATLERLGVLFDVPVEDLTSSVTAESPVSGR